MADRRTRRPPEPRGPEQAFELAAHFLATRPRSRWEVRRRLQRAAVEPATIERVLERLVSAGLVDDLAFARWWREQRDRHAPRGRRMLEAELRGKGIPRDVIEALRGEAPEWAAEDAALPTTEDERGREALDGHLRGRPVPSDRRALERLGMFLVRRGFEPGTARSIIRERAAAEAGDAPDDLSEPAG
ncbi:MAG: regulatory protein RecX [Chloroflexota bacterium]